MDELGLPRSWKTGKTDLRGTRRIHIKPTLSQREKNLIPIMIYLDNLSSDLSLAITEQRDAELLVLEEDDLPDDILVLKQFCMDLFHTQTVFQERCKEALRQLIEEKHIALRKNALLEQSVGIKDKETSERFIDQLQYWQDENEKQAAHILNLKRQMVAMESMMKQQEEFYRKNLNEISQQHTEQLQAIFKRNEETEKTFMLFRQKYESEAADLARARAELATSAGGRKASQAFNPSLDANARVELQALRQELAETVAEKMNLADKLNLLEKLKTMLERENNDLRNEMQKTRKNASENFIKELQTAREEEDEKDETDGTVVFAKGDGPMKRLKGGTADKLVSRLLDPLAFDTQFLQAFLLTYKVFMTSREFMNQVMKTYQGVIAICKQSEDKKQAPALLRIVNTVKMWMDNFWVDFEEDKSLLSDINELIDQLDDDRLKTILQNVITRKLQGPEPTRPATVTNNAPKPVLPRQLLKRTSVDFGSKNSEDVKLRFLDLDPLEIARQMTLIEADLFSKLKGREFLEMAWMKDDKYERSPYIIRMIQWSNHIVNWLVTEIVSVKDVTKLRVTTFERIITVAQQLEKLNNFNGIKEVLAALQSSSVYRLKKTKEPLIFPKLVGNKFMKIYEELMKLTSSELNYKALRYKVRLTEPPLIPFPGVYQGDLVFLETCNKNHLEGGLINFGKFEKVHVYISELLAYQKTPYSLEPVVEIQEYIKSFVPLSEEQAYSASLVCEPRGT
ncbi:hypothetical protein HDU76_000130 [Blyttiomyces sp. JEL0837]|nr:hypothetical protein HDU76_000130 [Blyttiomyces sp. JEL0837]